MNPSLNNVLQPPTEFLCPAGLFGLCFCHRQHALFQNPSPGLPYSNWLDARELVEADEVPWHQRCVGHPGWSAISHPVTKFPENLP